MKLFIILSLLFSLSAFSQKTIVTGGKPGYLLKKNYDKIYQEIIKHSYYPQVKEEVSKRDIEFNKKLLVFRKTKEGHVYQRLMLLIQTNQTLHRDMLQAKKKDLTLVNYNKERRFRYKENASKVLNDFYLNEGKGLKQDQATEKAYIITKVLIEKIKDLKTMKKKASIIDVFSKALENAYQKRDIEKILLLKKGLSVYERKQYKKK